MKIVGSIRAQRGRTDYSFDVVVDTSDPANARLTYTPEQAVTVALAHCEKWIDEQPERLRENDERTS